KILIIIFIGLTTLFYSAWYINLPLLSLDWFLYCLSWIPLTLIFIASYKYRNKERYKQRLH
ncbi:MAG: hypothetical protein V7749_15095, partial [Cocleimonas sp.]